MHHKGMCSNVHGHTYKVEIYLSDKINSKTGMVADFSDLDDPVKQIINKMDHAMIVNANDIGLINYLHVKGYKFYLIDGDPTAELIGLHFLHKLKEKNLPVVRIVVWETSKCKAEVTIDDLHK